MNTSRIVFAAIFGLFALIVSIWIGVGIATDQIQTLLLVGGVAGFLICALLGQKIWLVMIFLLGMEIPIIRGFSTQELGQFLFIGFSVALFLMRRLRLHMNVSELDFWRVAVAMLIVQAYIRNPVGLNMFGASQVGGKPYALAALACLAGFILSRYRINPSEIKWTMKLSILGSVLAFPLTTWRYGLQSSPNISNVQVVGEGLDSGGAGRSGSLIPFSLLLARIITSYISPLRACFHPLWAIALLVCVAAAAGGGFRNTVANVGLILLAGIAYRGGMKSVIISTLMGIAGLAALAILNLAFPLPANIQRALSPFPGSWEQRHLDDASNSTTWRVEMWKEALFTDDWIQNKFFGDGLGFSKTDLAKMESLKENPNQRTLSGLTSQQESIMISGDYHSGPVQTIRTVGYLGLIVMLIAMTRMAIITHREILRCKGTEWFPILLFFGIPIVISPIFFTFIFGTFQTASVFIFIQSGLMDLFRKNLPLPPYVKPEHRPALLNNRNLPDLQTPPTRRRRFAGPFNE